MTIELRPFRPSDLPAVAALLADSLPYDPLTPAYVRYLILDDPGFDPHLVWVAEDGPPDSPSNSPSDSPHLAGVLVASLPDEPLQAPGGIKLFAVAPAYRRQGLATRLFDQVEATLRARGVKECVAVNCGNNRLTLGLDVRHTAALCLLLARGYQSTGPSQDMSVPLHNPAAHESIPDLSTEAAEARLLAQGVVVRRARPEEQPWVCAGVERTMVPPTPGRRWAYLAAQAFRHDDPHRAPTIEIAEDTRTHTFLGFAAYDAARWGALGPMGVAPDARHAGLGSVLLKRCLRDMQADGYPDGDIFSVGPIPFYAKTINARITRVYYRYTKNL